MKLAYLAGPIDQGEDPTEDGYKPRAEYWRAESEAALTDLGFDVFRPDRAFASNAPSAAIQAANNAVIDTASAMVALLPSGVPTLGTPVEIERALTRRVPVLIVSDIAESVQVYDWISRGALWAAPGELAHLIVDLYHKVESLASRPSFGRAARDLAAALSRSAGGPRPLVFSPADVEFAHDARLPTRGYPDDAGLDLYVSCEVEIPPHSFVDVPCGVRVDIPDGHWVLITGRSSTLRKRHLMVNPGVIDAGWTGELFAGVWNMGNEPIRVQAGDRLAQMILLPAPVVGMTPEWGRIRTKDRGSNGFGSTGA